MIGDLGYQSGYDQSHRVSVLVGLVRLARQPRRSRNPTKEKLSVSFVFLGALGGEKLGFAPRSHS